MGRHIAIVLEIDEALENGRNSELAKP